MKKIIFYIAILCLLFTQACNKEDSLNADLSRYNIDTFENGPLDDWLTTEFLDPYNMEVKYRYDRYMLALNKEIVPVFESQVQPAMEDVRDIWLKPYEEVAGKTFIKTLAPKQIVLVGSAEYNTNGTITLGTADGGRRIVLYVINNYSKTNLSAVTQMMHTIHHEFTHIINQQVPIPPDYKTISTEYTGNWTQASASEAKSLGFISQYARANEMEDFAEMTSLMLVNGPEWFNSYVNTASASAATKLRKKEQLVVDYFKLSHGIDFRALQAKVQARMELLNPVSFGTHLARGAYTSINIPATQPGQSTAFRSAFTAAKNTVQAVNNLTLGDEIRLVYFSPGTDLTQVQLQYTMVRGTTTYLAYFDYTMTVNAAGRVRFTRVAARGTTAQYGNASAISANMAALEAYITGSDFQANWMTAIIPDSKGKLGGFFKVADPASYFYGSLQ